MMAPFPWFGGKSRVADLVWSRFGSVRNYVEPFFGSGAVLLAREYDDRRTETINDADGFVANFWRATAADPESVAAACDWPVNEADLHARHLWLVSQREDLTARLMGDPDFCDSKIAGWWVWGVCSWIGSGWCSGAGPWGSVDGRLQMTGDGDNGQGINRKIPNIGNHHGRGINRKKPNLGDAGRGLCADWSEHLADVFCALRDRLRRVRVCCGDWERVCGYSPTECVGVTAVFLDPPYSGESGRGGDVYAIDDHSLSLRVREWCAERGQSPRLRIALCGYEGEHDALESLGWSVSWWKSKGGYGSQGDGRGRDNSARERIWFSPHCLADEARQGVLPL
jgi:DNA adenine methylase